MSNTRLSGSQSPWGKYCTDWDTFPMGWEVKIYDPVSPATWEVSFSPCHFLSMSVFPAFSCPPSFHVHCASPLYLVSIANIIGRESNRIEGNILATTRRPLFSPVRIYYCLCLQIEWVRSVERWISVTANFCCRRTDYMPRWCIIKVYKNQLSSIFLVW